MSQQPPPDRPSAEKERLSKYMKRVSTILRKGPGAKRSSISGLGQIFGGESSKAPAPQGVTRKTDTTPAIAAAPETSPTKTSSHHWSIIQQEKARVLFAKYGLTLEPEEWMQPRNVNIERVEKPIRMRVRRICHRCQTTFGPDKVCVNCQHVRCKKCPRDPPARSKEKSGPKEKPDPKSKTTVVVLGKESSAAPRSKQKLPPLTLPSRTGGQNLVRKPIKQRIRRNCHKCGTLFRGDAKECLGCNHIRCKKCPRDPAKPKKYPNGYPGDVEPPPEPLPRVWKKPRLRVRYICHRCAVMYPPGNKSCSNCGQERGPETIRDPPRKIQPELDPDIVRRVQERLAALGFNE